MPEFPSRNVEMEYPHGAVSVDHHHVSEALYVRMRD